MVKSDGHNTAAFPHESEDPLEKAPEEGMSWIDYAAIQMSREVLRLGHTVAMWDAATITKESYDYAEALWEERERRRKDK